ncbi:MAG: substrate-binding domain-containing protein [Elusimicrobiota bacterium]|nr:substrate-binding domain-containing protein [Elusimicrobiota bacterium]
MFCKIAKHGQIVNDRHNAFISDYLDGIIEEASANGFDVQVAAFSSIPLQSVYDEINAYQNIAGCIILSTEFSESDIKLFGNLKKPFVFLDSVFDFEQYDFATMDNENMTFQMIKYFKDCGHTEIGMFYCEHASNFLRRKKSFIKALEFLGIEFKQEWMFEVGSTLETSRQSILERVKLCKKLPTAFFAINDIVAIGAIEALQSIGIDIPLDISIGGFDDIPASSLINPSLTTISVPKFDIGRVSVSALFRQINDRKMYKSQKIILSGEIIIRQSSK